MENDLKISKITRKDIFLGLPELDIEKILSTVLDFEGKESNDSRYKNMSADWRQHRINNPEDRPDGRFIDDERLNLLSMSDDDFLKVLCDIIHPDNITDPAKIIEFAKYFNSKLRRDSYELVINENISGRPLYKGRRISLEGTYKENINFYTVEYSTFKRVNNLLPKSYILPCVLFVPDSWDDYTYSTLFTAYVFLEQSKYIDLKYIKILDDSSKTTVLPNTFTQLPESFCSLFQSIETYRKLSSPELIKYNILHQLNDLTVRNDLLIKVRDTDGFNQSLTRESEANSIIEKILSTADASFNFTNQSINPTYTIKFNFLQHPVLPYRTNVIIGKNGSGKTRTLTTIASTLVKYGPGFTEYYNNKRPGFTKIISISYSAFDNFLIPKAQEISYKYCGLRDETGTINIEVLENNLKNALSKINEKKQEAIRNYFLKELLEDYTNITNIEENFSNLSSGQKILITIFSEIIANIEENSLLLFDEPETHLHPNMIFKLIKIMNQILDDYNSYLIIGTHSPIVIQQIPAKYVHILNNIGGITYLKRLDTESFGENFSSITKEVFGNYESEHIVYKDLFDRISRTHTKEEIENAFNNKLSMNAQIYLETLFSNQQKGEI